MSADPFTLRQVDQARDDFAALQDDLDFIKVQLAQLPTPSNPSVDRNEGSGGVLLEKMVEIIKTRRIS